MSIKNSNSLDARSLAETGIYNTGKKEKNLNWFKMKRKIGLQRANSGAFNIQLPGISPHLFC